MTTEKVCMSQDLDSEHSVRFFQFFAKDEIPGFVNNVDRRRQVLINFRHTSYKDDSTNPLHAGTTS